MRQYYTIHFVRRRYGNRHTFTWATLNNPLTGQSYDLGDPYPGVRWKRSELAHAAQQTLKKYGLLTENSMVILDKYTVSVIHS